MKEIEPESVLRGDEFVGVDGYLFDWLIEI